MNPSKNQLNTDVERAIEFFTQDEIALKLPFMHSFPRNCCEVVSALLAECIRTKYQGAVVHRIQGTNPSNNEHHFWIEINDQVLDPTAHQFDSFSAPIICSTPSPLSAKFSLTERQTAKQALHALVTLGVNAYFQKIALSRLAEILSPNQSSQPTAYGGG
jgi:hypothetical protein